MDKRIRIMDTHMSISCNYLEIDKIEKIIDVYNNDNYITSLDLKNARLEYINQSSRTKFYKIAEK